MIRARVQNRQILFSSFIAEQKFFELAEGKDINIAIDDAPTANMRRYFEGAIVPSVFYQNPHSGWENFKDAREALKIEFLSGYTRKLKKGKGRRTRYTRSTTELSKEGFTKLLDIITRWMDENGLEVPDPEEFKAWRDSAPARGEIYPPLLRMKEAYDAVQ